MVQKSAKHFFTTFYFFYRKVLKSADYYLRSLGPSFKVLSTFFMEVMQGTFSTTYKRTLLSTFSPLFFFFYWKVLKSANYYS